MNTIMESHIPNLPVRRGKVRDVYDLGDTLLIVATDRISAFDVIMPTPIPGKGEVLTALGNYWFNQVSGMVKHHILATRMTDFPAELQPFADQLAGRAILARKTQVIPVECVVRGYIAGGGWKEYRQQGTICGVTLPPGLNLCQKLAHPIFTPTTKATAGHDESIHFARAAEIVGMETMEFVRDMSIRIYEYAAKLALTRGIIIADTKFEWGFFPGEKQPILIDEILTPDSSRFWPAAAYQAGREQNSFDKQYVRDYLETLNWNKQPPGPHLPPDVVHNTLKKYLEAYETLTGEKFHATSSK